MLRSVTLTNYRCFRRASVSFGPLTVLVGPNGSGKSSLMQALPPVAQMPATIRTEKGAPTRIRLDLGDMSHIRSDGTVPHWEGHGERPNLVAQELHLNLASLRHPNTTFEATTLAKDGSNLTNVFDTLRRQEQESLAEQFCRMVPLFRDISARPTKSSGQKELLFYDRWDEELIYRPNEVSDGTMLVLAYLVLQYQRPQVDLVTIEEPERGLHPFLLGELIHLLRSLANGELGSKPVQVVLATHSAELLEHVEPSEVRFFTRSSEDGSVVVNPAPVDTPNWQQAFREYDHSLGGLWLSGGLGGVPGT